MKKTFALVIINILFMLSCNNNNIDTNNNGSITDPYINIIVNLGYNISEIEKIDNSYLVEKDIYLTQEYLENILKQKPLSRQTYYGTNQLVSLEYQKNIVVVIPSEIKAISNGAWHTAFKDAAQEWNAIQGCNLKFEVKEYPDGDNNITVEKWGVSSNNSYFMKTSPPLSGKPGNTIWLNPNYKDANNMSASQKKLNAIHILGHSIGLGHSTFFGNLELIEDCTGTEKQITGTPNEESSSVMSKDNILSSFTSFTVNDKKAICLLYPTPPSLTLSGPNSFRENTIQNFSINAPSNYNKIEWDGGDDCFIISKNGTNIQ